MLLKTILKRVYQYTQDRWEDDAIYDLSCRADRSGKALYTYINSYAASDITSLRDLVPNAFPKKLRHGDIIASKNIHGAWRVDPVLNKQVSEKF